MPNSELSRYKFDFNRDFLHVVNGIRNTRGYRVTFYTKVYLSFDHYNIVTAERNLHIFLTKTLKMSKYIYFTMVSSHTLEFCIEKMTFLMKNM